MSNGYVRRTKKCRGRSSTQLLHRFLLGAPKGKEVDHINGDRLDNRRRNLRITSLRLNRVNQKLRTDNTSGYKGVTWDKEQKNWKAQVSVMYRNKFLGYFTSKEEAALAYNRKAKELYGEYARLNVVTK